MKTQILIAASTAIFLSACQMGTTGAGATVDPLDTALRGKTLTNGGSTVLLGQDGTMSGMVGPKGDTVLEGAWTVRNGQYCRTVVEPAQIAGTECQDVTIDGNMATFRGPRGESTWMIG